MAKIVIKTFKKQTNIGKNVTKQQCWHFVDFSAKQYIEVYDKVSTLLFRHILANISLFFARLYLLLLTPVSCLSCPSPKSWSEPL